MARYEAKTKPAVTRPADYIATLEDSPRKRDAEMLLPWFEKVTGLKACMWGPSIIGFGRYAYTYESGHSGEHMLTGFSPRKANTVVYILPGYRDLTEKLARLGPHKTGKSCLYLGKLSAINMPVLEEIVADGVAFMRKNYQTWDE
ncbi:DUF1801 domain-containing protein [Hyphomonas sp.]|uniref:DUF1801 domain-containing protein n=1 Tax=Hyphomonas sp. TaxID=87 RepID=UPI001BCBEBE3